MMPPRSLSATIFSLAALVAVTGCGETSRTFNRPAAASLGPDGSVYVSDFHNHRIVHLNRDGSLVRTFGQRGLGHGELWQAWDISALRDGRLLVMNQRITDVGDETQIFDIKEFKNGEEIASHEIANAAIDPKAFPHGFAEGRNGQWFVPDTGRQGLWRFSSTWRPLGILRKPQGGGEFKGISAIVRSREELWIVEKYAHQIRRLTLDVKEELRFGVGGQAPGQLKFPSSLGVCAGKWVAVADYGNHRIQRFDYDGTFVDGFSPSRASPHAPTMLMSVVVTEDCQRLFLVDSKGNRVLVTTPRGEILREIKSW